LNSVENPFTSATKFARCESIRKSLASMPTIDVCSVSTRESTTSLNRERLGMDLGLHGKVAMVAGASKGLGFAVARALALAGAHVSIVSRDAASITQAATNIEQETGAAVLALPVDLRSPVAVLQWRDRTVERFGRVDMLFTNTGGPPTGGFFEFDDYAWREAFELLVLSVVGMVRAVIPVMKAQGGGSITLATSALVIESSPDMILSSVLRASVASLAKAIAIEFARDGIRINHIIPGRIDTGRVREFDELHAGRAGITPSAWRERVSASIPIGRYGTPDEFAQAVVFLSSNAASYITGATLQVDGGKNRCT